MKNKRHTVVALAAAMILGGSHASAQANDRPRRPQAGPDVETIMSMRERLELTDQQLATLESIRRENVQRRNQERAEMEEMRSQLRAGQIRRSQMMAYLEERRDEALATVEERRARVESVLTDAQRETLTALRARVRARVGRGAIRGERGFRTDPGVRGGRTLRPGRGARGARAFRDDVRRWDGADAARDGADAAPGRAPTRDDLSDPEIEGIEPDSVGFR